MTRPNATVKAVAESIEQVLASSGWIDGAKVYMRADLEKLALAIARRAAEPERFCCQGFHRTSLTQSLMLRLLTDRPQKVAEIIASIATTGRAVWKTGTIATTTAVNQASLALDVEARLAQDDLCANKGIRDAAGQLFDLFAIQLFWDVRKTERQKLEYRQLAEATGASTGERLLRVDPKMPGRSESVYEGPMITVRESAELFRLFDPSMRLIAHERLARDTDLFAVASAEELEEAAREQARGGRTPTSLIGFAGQLPGASAKSAGHDIHVLTALYDEGSRLFFCQSHWGQNVDLHLNGLSAADLFAVLAPPTRHYGAEPMPEPDRVPFSQRVIDPAYPIRMDDQAPHLARLADEIERLRAIERQARNTPEARAQEKYFKELELWEAARAEHESIFGDSVPFSRPKPKPTTNS